MNRFIQQAVVDTDRYCSAGTGSASHGFASTTFEHQLRVARRVAGENPHLYFEIQQLNDFGLESLERLRDVVERMHRDVAAGDEQAFVDVMRRGGNYLESGVLPVSCKQV